MIYCGSEFGIYRYLRSKLFLSKWKDICWIHDLSTRWNIKFFTRNIFSRWINTFRRDTIQCSCLSRFNTKFFLRNHIIIILNKLLSTDMPRTIMFYPLCSLNETLSLSKFMSTCVFAFIGEITVHELFVRAYLIKFVNSTFPSFFYPYEAMVLPPHVNRYLWCPNLVF